MKTRSIQCLFCVVVFLSVNCLSTQAEVKIWEDSLVLPTYIVNPPNPMPRFYEGRTHQGVQRHIYPYPMNDMLTRNREDRSYHIVYLENDFIKIGVMPGMGGRIFSGVDKTNNYDFFYRQHVIKPSLIGMVGFWISGSNAWGFPHHHGPNTVKPMDYRLEKHDDGSSTIWIANVDQRHRMRVLIGYTLFPNSSVIEMTIRPMNRTPVVNSFLFWANPSVHVDTTYQVIFPPSVKYVTQHAKREMTSWPISVKRYNNFDYENVNISLWKNIGVPSSFFSWKPQENYFGGYNHGKKAGTVWIGNHHVTPGMKFWAWGNNPGGDRANADLTDTDGHYIELMAGAYTDNQPDYSWIQPYEGKDVKMVWFPVRELGGLKYANVNGALNVQIKNRTAQIRLNTTQNHNQAKVILKAKSRTLFEQNIEIGPDKPFVKDVAIPENIGDRDVQVMLTENDGTVILDYIAADHQPSDEPMPESLKAPQEPEKIKTIEELYLTGLRLNQFYNASLDPMPYYTEALKRDPGDYRVNTQLGILCIKQKKWQKAEEYLQAAVDRITSNYTRPKDGEALYYLGYVLKMQGKYTEAYDYLYRATWSAAWHSPAYYQLAEIDCRNKDFITAIDHLDRSLSTDVNNLKALDLKAAALRKLGRYAGAVKLAGRIAEMDLLDHQCRNELYLIETALGNKIKAEAILNDLTLIMRDEVQSYLELAADYGSCGFYEEAIAVLKRLEEKDCTYPMLYYYLGYYNALTGQQETAGQYYTTAAGMPSTYCFPFRAESIEVLKHAMEVNPADARAPYYFGNLLYEKQPENAVIEWEKARSLDPDFYIVHRNLGVAYEEFEKDIPKAIKSLEKAAECNSTDPRLLYELDVLYEKNKVAPEKRYAILKKNMESVRKKSETLLRAAMTSVQVGKYDEALDILLNNFFPQWEGGREKQNTYLDAYTLRGLAFYKSGKYKKALQDFETALAYPLERWGRSRRAQLYYLAGETYKALGDNSKAGEYFKNALQVTIQRNDREYSYYQGEALKKTGKKSEAEKIFNDMLAGARAENRSDFFRQFEGSGSADMRMAEKHFLAGLAFLGLENKMQAKKEFQAALELNPTLVWARIHLKDL